MALMFPTQFEWPLQGRRISGARETNQRRWHARHLALLRSSTGRSRRVLSDGFARDHDLLGEELVLHGVEADVGFALRGPGGRAPGVLQL